MPTLPIEIFRPGTHTDMHGNSLSFGESDIADMATAYDPALSEAPIVVGHPKASAPAFGWIASLTTNGDRLLATPKQVDPAFAELVRAGRYKRVSASFYLPDSPSNPRPGSYYLRHVGFLGAMPPAVKGLAPVEFAAADSADVVTVEYGEESAGLIARVAGLLRGLRDYIIEREGTGKADAVLPSWQLESLLDNATALAAGSDIPAYSESVIAPTHDGPAKDSGAIPKEQTMDNAELAKRIADLEARESALALRQRESDAQAVVNAAIRAGQLTPAQAEGLASFMAACSDEQTVSFAEHGSVKTMSPSAFMVDFLGRLPVQVDFAERAARQPGDSDDVTPGTLAQRAVAYRERLAKDGILITTADAVLAVDNGADAQEAGK